MWGLYIALLVPQWLALGTAAHQEFGWMLAVFGLTSLSAGVVTASPRATLAISAAGLLPLGIGLSMAVCGSCCCTGWDSLASGIFLVALISAGAATQLGQRVHQRVDTVQEMIRARVRERKAGQLTVSEAPGGTLSACDSIDDDDATSSSP